MQTVTLTENYASRPNGRGLFYLAAGPEDGPLVSLVHGWPELAISWQNQLLALVGLGFRAVAPDLPGYGRSWNSCEVEDYATESIVAEMRFLLSSLGRETAVWIGHDMGSPIVWSIAAAKPPSGALGIVSASLIPGDYPMALGAELVDAELNDVALF